MKNRESWQVEAESARFYEEYFVPALFAQWAPRTVNAVHIKPGDRVLDVACGTGLAARFAANKVGKTGSVVGYDLNPGMLAVAARIAPQIEWVLGPAEQMTFATESFDAVICQFGLMFFQDQVAALREMYRVLRKGGTLALTVWCGLEQSPGYAALVGLLTDTCGEQAAAVLRAPFELGDLELLKLRLDKAGLQQAHIETQTGMVRYNSIAAWIECEVQASPIRQMVDEVKLNALKRTAEHKLKAFTQADGRVVFDAPARLITITKG